MIRTLKWIYKLGNDMAMNYVFTELERARDFHRGQAHIKELMARDEQDLSKDLRSDIKTTSKQHEERAKAIEELLTHLDPKRYPDIDKFMELLS